MTTADFVDIDPLRKRIAAERGAVPTVVELVGAEHTFAPTGEDLHTIVARQRRDVIGTEATQLRIARMNDVGKPSCGVFDGGEGDIGCIGTDDALEAEVGDIEAIGVGKGSTHYVEVSIGKGLGGVDLKLLDLLERSPDRRIAP